jgi:hypothetical protein
MSLWIAVVLYIIVLTHDMATWIEVLFLCISLALYFLTDYLWGKQTTKIAELEKKVKNLENCAITNIEEESPNHFIVKRRLGPDKEE